MTFHRAVYGELANGDSAFQAYGATAQDAMTSLHTGLMGHYRHCLNTKELADQAVASAIVTTLEFGAIYDEYGTKLFPRP